MFLPPQKKKKENEILTIFGVRELPLFRDRFVPT